MAAPGDFIHIMHINAIWTGAGIVAVGALVLACTPEVKLEPINDPATGGAAGQTAQGGSSQSGGGNSNTGGTTSGPASGGAQGYGLYIDHIEQSTDCGHELQPDPLTLTFSFNIATMNWAPTITPVAARIESPAGVTSFQTDMGEFGTGVNVDIGVEVNKLPNTATGDHACVHCNAQSADLVVDVLVDGMPDSVSATFTNNCLL
jgi:hypothetical protein